MNELVLIVGVGSGLNEIAKTYLQFYYQDKSAWSWEVELRTLVKKF